MVEKKPDIKSLIGNVYPSPGRTIGEGEFCLAQSVTWVTGDIHTNKELMKNSPFGERIMGGPLVLAFMWGLEEKSRFFPELEEHGYVTLAMVTMDQVKIKNPIKPGDTIRVETTIMNMRQSSRNPENIIMTRKINAFNQNKDMVAELSVISILEPVKPQH